MRQKIEWLPKGYGIISIISKHIANNRYQIVFNNYSEKKRESEFEESGFSL